MKYNTNPKGATVISIFNGRERTLGGQISSVHVQVSIDFRDYLHTLKGARLATFLSIALHSNEDGWSWPSRALISRETGYNTNTISQALSKLCNTRIKNHRILLRYQPQAGNGNFKTNRYLLFPSPHEIAQYEHHQPEMNLPCTAQPCTENPYTVKPYTANLHTNKNHDKEEPNGEEETSTTTPAVAVDFNSNLDNESYNILYQLGILEPTLSELLKLPHTSPQYLQHWADWYIEQEHKIGLGLIVDQVRKGAEAPLTKAEMRLSRYQTLKTGHPATGWGQGDDPHLGSIPVELTRKQ